jgi:L-asparaginase II
VVAPDGQVIAALGDVGLPVYVRSAAKPFQAVATLELLDAARVPLDAAGVAIACASHAGSDMHQIEAARLLALADLDESALRCPPALPDDLATLLAQRTPTSLAHNCSGKHAAFVLAQVAAGGDPSSYLAPGSPIQQAVTRHLAAVTSSVPAGPGVDGCGAPAWLVPLRGLALAFARLAGGHGLLARVRAAMTARPDLVGGAACPDTALMTADARIVAKRGAEAVFAAGYRHPRLGPLGVAVKIADGSARAAAPATAAALEALGAAVPALVLRPLVLGGFHPHGALLPSPAIAAAVAP